jgi:PAS domain S-box-containing protein
MTEKKSKKVNNRSVEFSLTKKHEIESLVQEQNKWFRVICSSKNDAVITSDETKQISFWNKGAEYIFGYTSAEAIGQPLTLIIPHELHHRPNEGIERMNQRKKPRVLGKVLELKAIKKAGKNSLLNLRWGAGITMAKDITAAL